MPNLAPASDLRPAPSAVIERPVASVIIPTLNEEKTLAGVLEPLWRAVNRCGIELIVSDGGSQDGTLGLALGLADHVVTHEGIERQTIAAGRNAGARRAGGDVLLFFNADVGFPSDIEAFLIELIDAARTAGAATCRVAVDPADARWDDRVVLGICNALFWGWNRIGLGMGRGECHAIRRDLFERLGGYNEGLVAGEDFDLFRRVAGVARREGAPRIRFLWHRVVYEDPRRYRQRGYLRTMLDWLLNSISVSFRGRSHSRTWDAIR